MSYKLNSWIIQIEAYLTRVAMFALDDAARKSSQQY